MIRVVFRVLVSFLLVDIIRWTEFDIHGAVEKCTRSNLRWLGKFEDPLDRFQVVIDWHLPRLWNVDDFNGQSFTGQKVR